MQKTILLLTTVFSGFLAASASAQILSNGTNGDFSTGTTWVGGSAPTSAQSWEIVSGDNVTSSAQLIFDSGATGTVNGSFVVTDNVWVQNGGGFTLNVNGSMSADRIFNNAAQTASYADITVASGGSLTVGNRFLLTGSATAATSSEINKFTLNADGNIYGINSHTGFGFQLFGADADDRAQFNIIGNGGTFDFDDSPVLLNNGTGTSATDINFTFGADAGAAALTVVESGNLTLGGNTFTLDFSSIDRVAHSGTFSTTLFDYSGTLTGTFGTLNSVGLGAGESASLFHDATNKFIGVEYTVIPEPSSIALFFTAVFTCAVFFRRRKR